jgi:hypothetical protein
VSGDEKSNRPYDDRPGVVNKLADYPWKPFTLAVNTKDNLLVVFRYDPQPGYMVNGMQETVPRLPDDNPMYSGWAAWCYSIDPANPDGVIIIPETYDLSRSAALSYVISGQAGPFYVANENNKTTVGLDVLSDSRLTNLRTLYPQGQYSSVTDSEGNL